jgi:hypothetical protein
MKHFTAAILLLALCSSPVLARLGEDETTAGHRYDDPVSEEKVSGYDRKLLYHDPPYNIAITFKDNRAVIITYQLVNNEQMSIWRIEQILEDNAKKEGGWKSIWFFGEVPCGPDEISFINGQKNAVAVYNLKKDALTIRYKNDSE